MRVQVAVVGAGPAGLAAAINLARRGLEVVVCERRATPPDKACGEGLMPAGVCALATLGALEHIGPQDCHSLTEVHYVQEDGTVAAGRLPSPGGMGIRRTALASALARVASACGVQLLWSCSVLDHRVSRQEVLLLTSGESIEAELLVAADGLHSPLRHAAGLEAPTSRRRRFGLRRHFRMQPAGPWVEVHLAAGVEAFVTPVGVHRVGVAFLWDRVRLPGPVDFASFLARFPRLADRLADAPADSSPLGAGPLEQASSTRVQDRMVLIGDAAGYVDAVTGEGMSLAFAAAAALGEVAPSALARGANRDSLLPYEQHHRRYYRKYAAVTRAVLAVAQRPRLRRGLIYLLSRHPGLLDRLIAWGIS